MGDRSVAVVVVPRLDRDWIDWLSRIHVRHPILRTTLVTGPDAETLFLLAPVAIYRVIPTASLRRLSEIVRTNSFSDFFMDVEQAIRTWPRMSAALTRTVIWLIRFTPRAKPVARDDPRALPHTVEEIAHRLNHSPSYLRNLASACGFPLGRFVHAWLALRGLEMVVAESATPETAAWRLGYESPSGFSDLCVRHFSLRPGDVGATDLPTVFERFRADALARRMGPGQIG